MSFWKRKFTKTYIAAKQKDVTWTVKVLKIAQQALAESGSLEDKILICEYIIQTFKMEYIAHLRTEVLREENPSTLVCGLFPCQITLADGTIKKFLPSTRWITPIGSSTAVKAWRIDRLARILPTINKQPFQYDEDNHIGVFYPYLELSVIFNGTHSCSSGAFLQKGEIPMDVYDITQLFDHIYYDGGPYWCNKHTNQPLPYAADPHVGVIFEIARIKHTLESERFSEEFSPK